MNIHIQRDIGSAIPKLFWTNSILNHLEAVSQAVSLGFNFLWSVESKFFYFPSSIFPVFMLFFFLNCQFTVVFGGNMGQSMCLFLLFPMHSVLPLFYNYEMFDTNNRTYLHI